MAEKKRKLDQHEGDEVAAPKAKQKPHKKQKSFDVKLFRKSLKTNDFIFEVGGFVKAASEDPSIVTEYLESKGTILELVEALPKVDSSNLDQISTVFDAIQIILLEVTSNQDYKGVAVPGITFLINNSKSLLLKVLQSETPGHRNIVLKLLTGAVVLGISAIQVLRLLDSLVAERSIEESIFQGFKMTPDDLRDNVRKSYIQLVMSFLIEAELQVIVQVLQRDYLITPLMKGLVHDELCDVALILSTFQGILERTDVLKTQKKRAFSEESVRAILDVYKWKGPEFLIHRKENEVDLEVRKEAATIAHEFLKLLLTSRKYGIAFQALGRENKFNMIQSVVLRQLRYFWTDELTSDLVQAIITACPELIRPLMDRITFGIQPKLTESWFQCVLFTQNLIESTNVEAVLKAIRDLGPKRMSEYILNFSLCQSILQHIDEDTLLRGNSVEIRDQLLRLLLVMLRQCSVFLVELQKMDVLEYDLKKIKFNVINQIFSYFPSIETLLNALHTSIKKADSSPDECRSQLHSTLDIINLLNELVPSLLKKDSSIISYISVLRPIYEFQGAATEAAETDAAERLEMNLKVVKLMLILEPDALNVSNSLFAPVFETLVKVFVSESRFVEEAQNLLQKLLLSTEFFEEMLEVNVLLASLRAARGQEEAVTRFLIEVMRKPQSGDAKVSVEARVQDDVDFFELFERIEKTEVAEVGADHSSLSLFFPVLVKEAAGKNELLKFMEHLALGLFFTVPEKSVIAETFKQLESPLNKYFKKVWKTSPEQLPESCQEIASFISSIVSHKYSFELLENLHTEVELTFYLQILIFLVIELAKRDKFSGSCRTVSMDYVRKLLELSKNLKSLREDERSARLEETTETKGDKFIVEFIFCQQFELLSLFGFGHQELSLFVAELSIEVKGSFEGAERYFATYRNKLASELNGLIGRPQEDVDFENVMRITEAFEFTDQESVELVHRVLQLKLKKAQNKEFLLKLVSFCLQNLTNLRGRWIEAEDFARLGDVIVKLGAREAIQEALLGYLSEFPQSSGHLSAGFLDSLVEGEASKSSVRLACFLLEKRVSPPENFRDLVEKHLEKKEMVYPLLNVAAQKRWLSEETLTKDLLQRVYGEFKSGILKTIEKPLKVGAIYKENVQASICLVSLCMPVNECVDFCGKAIKFGGGAEVYQLQIMAAVYFKAVQNLTDDAKIGQTLSGFLNNFVSLFTFLLQKEGAIAPDVAVFSFILERFLDRFKEFPHEIEFQFGQNWHPYVKNCLRHGMNDKSQAASLVLRQLATVCDWVYPSESPDVTPYFELIFSHPEFFNIALKATPSDLKEQLFRLIFTLAKRNADMLGEKHLKVFLGSYQATFSSSDRYILALMQLFEVLEFTIPKPLVWGEAAILQHSLREEPQPTDLTSKKTSSETLALLDEKMVVNTFVNFPISRKLNAMEQLPELKTLAVDVGTRVLQQFVEQTSAFKEEVELVGAKTEDSKEAAIYDPAFIIPLVSMTFAPEQVDLTSVVVQKKLVSVVFAALSSKDTEMRLAAANVLSRAKTHLDGGKHFLGKELWTRLYEAVHAGLGAIQKDKEMKVPRPSTFHTLFIGHTTNILHNGLDDLFPVLSNYFVVKPVFDFSVIPEFLNLFYSPDIKYSQYRLFVIKLLRDGVKTIEDFLLIFKTPILKVVTACFGSHLSDTETDLAILEVFKSITKIPLATDLLVLKSGVLTWLHAIISRQETWFFDTISAIVDILGNVWLAVQESRENYKNLEEVELQLMALNLTLLPKLTVKIPTRTVEIFYDILFQSCRKRFDLVAPESYEAMLRFAEIVLGDQFRFVRAVESQGRAAETMVEFLARLKRDGVEEDQLRRVLVFTREFSRSWLESYESRTGALFQRQTTAES